jgi:hypothetical protein
MSDSINTGLGTVADDTYDYMNNLLANPSVIIILVIIIIIYVILFMSLGGSEISGPPSDEVSNSSSKTLTVIFIAFIIILIIVNGLQYFFGVDIIANLKNLFSGTPEVDITVDTSRVEAAKAPVPEILFRPQVFNIPGNDYVYPDAKALCSAYGARLATYKEVEDSYKNGGEWCNYGRPGVNGGYIANPSIRFGVNCYGYKPRMTEEEEDMMANNPIYPKTLKDKAMEERVNYWKDKLSEILVSPFNHTTWSKL